MAKKHLTLDPEMVHTITEKVGVYASFWDNHGVDLKNVSSELLKKFCEQNTFTSEEFESYKSGLASMLLFMELCTQSYENLKEPSAQ